MPYEPLRSRHAPGKPVLTSRTAPATDTMEEVRYLRRLSQTRKPVAVKLRDGTVVSGWIEYFDRSFIRLTREPLPNLFIYKWDILYIAEQPERRNAQLEGEPAADTRGPESANPTGGERSARPRPQAPAPESAAPDAPRATAAPGAVRTTAPARRAARPSAAPRMGEEPRDS